MRENIIKELSKHIPINHVVDMQTNELQILLKRIYEVKRSKNQMLMPK